MKMLKPYKNGYLLVLGNGKTIYFDINDLDIFKQAWTELKYIKEENRRSFEL